MGYGRIEYFSNCLSRSVSFDFFMPGECKEEKPGVLFLLHGYCGIASDWMLNCRLHEISDRYNLCIVLPNGENSFYLDGEATGRKYCTYVGEEIPQFVRSRFQVTTDKERTYIGGFSMGGFGALHTALAYPETFGKLFAFSSALITEEVAAMQPGSNNGVANYEYYRLMFGEPDKLLASKNNPKELIRRLLDAKKELPGMYIACGTEDFLIENNRDLVTFLKENNVAHVYKESEGMHNFDFWGYYLEPAVKWMVGEE